MQKFIAMLFVLAIAPSFADQLGPVGYAPPGLQVWAEAISKAVTRNFALPAGRSAQQPPVVHIDLATDGTVQTTQIRRSSGDPQIDEAALRAVMQSSPLPLPADPQDFLSSISVQFPLPR